jgi:hypothetical protein
VEKGVCSENKRKEKKFTHEMMVQFQTRQGFEFDLPKFEWPLKSLQTNHTYQLKFARIKEEKI